jgi:hypothetical protein
MRKDDEGVEKSFSLAAWPMVCRPKKKGGLGILNLKIQNDGLLLKYLHKFYNKSDTPWVTLLWNAYYNGKVPHAVDPCGSFWWRDICKLMPIFRGFASSTIGNGQSVLFWKDEWLANIKSECFPRAYSFSTDGDVSVQDFLNATSLSGNFHLPLSPQAMQEVRDLQQLVRYVDLSAGEDIWTYPWGASYSSSQYYKYCFSQLKPHDAFLWIWKSKCTPRVKFFTWLVLSDRLNTRNMLRRRNLILRSGYQCLMCTHPPEETLEHMLFFCPFSMSCWSTINMLWTIQGDRLEIIKQGKITWNKKLFMEIFMLGAWNIWKERNSMFFNNVSPTVSSWKARLKADLLLLLHRTKSSSHTFINQLVDSL